ncbi:MAG TPA: OmpA family protein, partial [Thermoanaerobaculia bacterium]
TLMAQYESALAAKTNTAEADRLRRELEDQNLRLRELQERERLSEESMSREIARLRDELEREREGGRLNAQAAAQRQAELDSQQQEFESIKAERANSERRRQEADRAYQAKIAEVEQRLRASEAEADQLRQQVAQQKAQSEADAEQLRQQAAQQKAQSDAAQAELRKAKDEITRREAEERRRSEDMQKALAAIAQTRTESRGFVITLPGIFFDTGKSTLKSGAKNILMKIADQLKANAEVKVMVEGHTDSVGSEPSNAVLSLARANAVRDHLVSIGIAASRITTTGKGEATPIATNDTAAGRQQNRRVEIVITQ